MARLNATVGLPVRAGAGVQPGDAAPEPTMPGVRVGCCGTQLHSADRIGGQLYN